MKTDLIQSCGHCWAFQICSKCILPSLCSTFTASSFGIWNSSTGIPSPPLTLSVVLLPKAHLTLHYRMSDFRWVITPSWLSGSWRSFLHLSSVYSCHLFFISSASVRSIPFVSFIVPIFSKSPVVFQLTRQCNNPELSGVKQIINCLPRFCGNCIAKKTPLSSE